MKFVQETPQFSISVHPRYPKIYQIVVDRGAQEAFFSKLSDVNSQYLTYVPFMRFVASHELQEILGPAFGEAIRGILEDRSSGAFTVQVDDRFADAERYILWGTAIAHFIGVPNFDAMSSNYYAIFTVRDVDDSDSFLRKAYRPLTLHTDGTFVSEPTDWVLMMKMEERNVSGGRSRLLHLDDWESLDRFSSHPLASAEITYKGSASKNVKETVVRRTFSVEDGSPCICFIDQFAYPDRLEIAKYLHDLSHSLETSNAVCHLETPSGGMVVINNHFWMHGREAFQKHPGLHRVLMRQRGGWYGS